MNNITLIATAAFGLEAVVAREIQTLGYTDTTIENGRVTFQGDLKAICRANLWLRCADRVLVKIGEFKVSTFDELFEQTKALSWQDWLPQDALFPVRGKSVKSQLQSVPDCQAIVKKAVVEKMKSRYRQQWFAETGARYAIEVALLKDTATLTIDTSGQGLHKRGYRPATGIAPLKETLAAALINLSRWQPERVLIDPMCGTGTIPIEAALIGLNQAPGLRRSFDAEKWSNIPGALWQEARQEAEDLLQRNRQLTIRGTDIDKKIIRMARHHATLAGVENFIHLQQAPLAELQARQKRGYLISNPPYGQRLEELPAVKRLYKELGQIYNGLEDWSCYILTTHKDFEKYIGRKADKKRKLYNGRIQCDYYQFFGRKPSGL